MFRIKRLYTFMLQSFIPLLLMTFFICLFIVLMQFLWKYIDDLVGKGLSMDVIIELFFYAALTMVPLALPLAILLASLMVFGNLGERFELTAMKASGVSLIKSMRPLIVLMILIAIGAFFFQNNVLPVAQTKMYTLLFSMRQKSPELEIPEGVFYDQIPGINLFVEKKDRETGTLYDMMIYDVSRGFDNARIILADSGRLSVTEDKTHLFLKLYQGEQFENLREQSAGGSSKNQPYRRETFDQKDILMSFDANFNRMDESTMRNQYIGKNIEELRATIDSVQERVDSVGAIYAKAIKETPYFGLSYMKNVFTDNKWTTVRQDEIKVEEPLVLDSVFTKPSASLAKAYINQALMKAKRNKQDYEFKSYSMEDDRKTIRRHDIELQKKFTLSFACIIFFFIGAPLGAIIRKGGIGTPLVISVFLFIVYYIIDNSGYKMARDGHVAVWQGMWLSSAILLPLGIFFTYKAVNDSAVFNIDAYKNFIDRIRGKRKRELEVKAFVMEEIKPQVALDMIRDFDSRCQEYYESMSNKNVVSRLISRIRSGSEVRETRQQLNRLVDYLSNSRDAKVIATVNQYPFDTGFGSIKKIIEVNTTLKELLRRTVAGDADKNVIVNID